MQLSYQPDPMGMAVMDYLKSGVDKPIRIWINDVEEPLLYPSVFFRSGNELPEIEKTALSVTKGKVLDVGAGAGCHSLELISRHLEVVSIEKSSKLCDVMKIRGLHHVVNQDVMDYHQVGFDTILLLMNGFGIAGTEDHLVDFLTHLKALLNPGGQIVGESTDIFYMIEQKPAMREIDLAAGYYGEVNFKLRYQNEEAVLKWLYADEFLLEAIAGEAGLNFEILDRGPDYNFLCRLSV